MSKEINLQMAVATTGQMRMMLTEHKEKIAAMMPHTSGISAEKILSSAIEVAGSNPQILQCTGLSVISSVKQAAEFGLTFSKAFGQAYLVSYGKECQLQIGYRGLLDLARRATDGDIIMDSDVVYSTDDIIVEKGTETKLIHKPNLTAPRLETNIIGAYFLAIYKDGRKVVEWMTIGEIEGIRSRSKSELARKAGKIKSTPWVTDFGSMCRKTVIRRGIKYLPMSAEKARLLEKAIEHDITTDGISDEPVISSKEKAAAISAELSGTPTSEIMPNDMEDMRI